MNEDCVAEITPEGLLLKCMVCSKTLLLRPDEKLPAWTLGSIVVEFCEEHRWVKRDNQIVCYDS